MRLRGSVKTVLFYTVSVLCFLPPVFSAYYYSVDPKTLMFATRDAESETLAKDFIAAFINKDLGRMRALAMPGAFDSQYLPALEELYRTNDVRPIRSMTLMDTGSNSSTDESGKKEYFTTVYEIRTDVSYYAITVLIDTSGERPFVRNLNFQAADRSLLELAGLRGQVNGKNVPFFLLGLGMTAVSVMAIRKIRLNQDRYRAISYIGVVAGLSSLIVTLNTGAIGFNLIALNFPPLSISRMGNLGLWRMTVSLPIYALYVLIRKVPAIAALATDAKAPDGDVV
ncbi:MAG: hypothetical protein CVV47_14420 [Spirochaetae bacterium HGW-Spirochaetae-3]|jgi:uncharacterized membrane protein|nr:MAG: hypothetical protein CVV47_14420 [Spirochaetae bacterium HGW-Spirochaetae-3]